MICHRTECYETEKALKEMAEVLSRGADWELYIPILRGKAAELRSGK